MNQSGPPLTLVNCAFCGEKEYIRLHVIRGLNIVQCPRCGLIYTNPRMVWDYVTSPDKFEVELDIYQRYYWPVRRQTALKFWDRLSHYCQTGKLMDVGCSYGFFLDEARRYGWHVMGLEPDSDQAAWARQHLGLPVVKDMESRELEPHSFDVLTLWDVIEHIEDPHSFLKRCHALIRPGGVLLLKTPNAEGLLQRGPWWLRPYLALYRQLIYPANPMQHLYHFTPQVIERLLQETGFSVVETDVRDGWSERTSHGRNLLVVAVRYPLMWIAWRLNLPFEIVMLAEPH
jgi:2-polyprenyl-3-methyl-5-hydroxy-6-metoxy-1,4-benzoquinol methylase